MSIRAEWRQTHGSHEISSLDQHSEKGFMPFLRQWVMGWVNQEVQVTIKLEIQTSHKLKPVVDTTYIHYISMKVVLICYF